MKTLTLIAVLALGGASRASFEMLLASDTAGDVVHRVDPMSGVYLGNFGGGVLNNPQAVAVDQSNNFAYVLDNFGTRVSRWNYNTGLFGGSFTTGFSANHVGRNLDGSLSLTGSAFSRRVTSNGSVIQSYSISSGFPGQHGFVGTDGLYYAYSSGGGGNRFLQWYTLGTGTSIGTSAWGADRLALIGGSRYFNAFTSSGGGGVLLEVDVINNGPQSFNQVFTAALTTITGAAVGHDGIAYASGTTAAGSGIIRFDTNTLTSGSVFGTNLGTISGIGIVVAPEPGTMIALAGGALALLRRRKR